MKVAVIADIHSNLMALNVILKDIKKNKVDKIIFLGDYITDGDKNNEILNIVKKMGNYVIRGNREDYILNFDDSKKDFANYKPIVYVYNTLSAESLSYIKTLKREMLIAVDGIKCLLVHGDGISRDDASLDEIKEVCDKLSKKYDYDICLYGHTHYYKYFEYNGKKYLNPGSCGQPCDGPYYKYVILNIEDNKVSFVLRTFDVSETFTMLKKEMMDSNFYLENKIWCDVILKTIELGEDSISKFLSLVHEELLKINDDNSKEYNKCYVKAFLRFKNSSK